MPQFEYYSRMCRFILDLHPDFTENNEKTICWPKKKKPNNKNKLLCATEH